MKIEGVIVVKNFLSPNFLALFQFNRASTSTWTSS